MCRLCWNAVMWEEAKRTRQSRVESCRVVTGLPGEERVWALCIVPHFTTLAWVRDCKVSFSVGMQVESWGRPSHSVAHIPHPQSTPESPAICAAFEHWGALWVLRLSLRAAMGSPGTETMGLVKVALIESQARWARGNENCALMNKSVSLLTDAQGVSSLWNHPTLLIHSNGKPWCRHWESFSQVMESKRDWVHQLSQHWMMFNKKKNKMATNLMSQPRYDEDCKHVSTMFSLSHTPFFSWHI